MYNILRQLVRLKWENIGRYQVLNCTTLQDGSSTRLTRHDVDGSGGSKQGEDGVQLLHR